MNNASPERGVNEINIQSTPSQSTCAYNTAPIGPTPDADGSWKVALSALHLILSHAIQNLAMKRCPRRSLRVGVSVLFGHVHEG